MATVDIFKRSALGGILRTVKSIRLLLMCFSVSSAVRWGVTSIFSVLCSLNSEFPRSRFCALQTGDFAH